MSAQTATFYCNDWGPFSKPN